MAPRDPPLVVQLPNPESENPPWAKVGIIAALGFLVGIAWPRLTGTRVAPNPPNDGRDAVVAARQTATSSASAAVPPTGGGTTISSASASTSEPAAQQPNVSVGTGAILRCREARDNKDEAHTTCGPLEFDPVAVPRIKAVARCPAAQGLTGKLSVGFDIDFRKKKIVLRSGRSTTFTAETADALIRCLQPSFDNLSLYDVPHEHRYYTVFYHADFTLPRHPSAPPALAAASSLPGSHAGSAAESASTGERAASEGPSVGTTTSERAISGSATVVWDVALVRETPKTGAIVGRILRGTKLALVARQGDWYRVRHANVEGWVHRSPLGI